MTDFGITPEGFRLKTQQDILDEIETDERAEIDPAIDTSPVSPEGQLNGVFSRQAALGWEELQRANDGLDPDKAEDDQLISLCKLTGTTPRGASFSEDDCTVNVDAGFMFISGTHFASVVGKPDVLFTPKVSDTVPRVGGAQTVRFRAQTAGPVIANAGTLTVIASPVVGWNTITNPLDATPGQAADDSDSLRARREQELAAAGSSTVQAIRADVLEIEDATGAKNVIACLPIENDTDAPVEGVPAHSVECIVYDSPTISNDLIAQALFEVKAAGIHYHGALTGTATDPDDGAQYTIKFSRPTSKNVYVTFDLTTGPGYIGDAAFKSAVVTALREAHSIGADVLHWTCQRVANLTGVLNVVSAKLGFSPSPTLSADLTITPREIAAFDTTRIVIT